MKLYATVTSERASKGQGGNKYLQVRFTIENDAGGYDDMGIVTLLKERDAYRLMYCANGGAVELIDEIPKGKRQKGEVWNEVSDIHEGQHKHCTACDEWNDKTQ